MRAWNIFFPICLFFCLFLLLLLLFFGTEFLTGIKLSNNVSINLLIYIEDTEFWVFPPFGIHNYRLDFGEGKEKQMKQNVP